MKLSSQPQSLIGSVIMRYHYYSVAILLVYILYKLQYLLGGIVVRRGSMKNPLIKRLPRELKGEIGKYIVLFLFITMIR